MRGERITNGRQPLTLNLTQAEMAALERLSSRKELSKSAIMRQALKLYEAIDSRIARGEKFFFEDSLSREKAELVML